MGMVFSYLRGIGITFKVIAPPDADVLVSRPIYLEGQGAPPHELHSSFFEKCFQANA